MENSKINSPLVNTEDVKLLLSKDKIFADIHEKYGVPPNWNRPGGFVSLSKIILEQQVSLASAKAHFLKLESYITEFTPANILRLSDEEMRACQISRQKAKYLKELSMAIQNGDLDFDLLSRMDEVDSRKQLMKIKGIGQWTTDVYLMFCLQSKDIFPIGDIALVNTAKELTPAKTREEIIAYAEKWKPVRSLASFYLWMYYLKKRNRPLG